MNTGNAPHDDGRLETSETAMLDSRVGWGRLVAVSAVTAAIVLWALYYGRMSVHNANNMRANAALGNCQALAVSCARHVEAQTDALLHDMSTAAASPALGRAIADGDAAISRRELARIADRDRELQPLAIYRADGRLLLAAAGSAQVPENASGAEWFGRAVGAREAGFDGPVSVPGSAASILLFAPVRSGGRTSAYLFARYPLKRIAEWQAGIGTTGAVYVVDSTGLLLSAAGGPGYQPPPVDALAEAARGAARRASGSTVAANTDFQHRMLIGYARVPQTGWTVVSAVYSEQALAASRYLVKRIFLLSIPGLALLLIAAWVLASFYSRQQRLAQQLVEHNRKLRAADQAKSDFLANVSHDLRTPLAGLRVSIGGLLDPGVAWNETQVRESLHVAADQVEQLNSRVRNLLEMARIEADAHPLQIETCDLTDIVSTALDRMRPLLGSRTVRVDFPAEPLLVDCDHSQIETVLLNLIENAVKYSPPGGAISLTGSSRHPHAVVAVRDEGPGLKPGEEDRVFQKFYRGSTTGPVGGTGLGLAICRSIVERHGGKIGARNVPDGGAEFWFALRLPVIEMAAPRAQKVAL